MFLTVDNVDELCLLLDRARTAKIWRRPERLEHMGASAREEAGVAVDVRDYDGAAEAPAAHVMVGTSLSWIGEPGSGVEVFVVEPPLKSSLG